MANDDAAAKLRTFALILKFGHDLMNARNFDDAAVRAVNDARMLLDFHSAALFEHSEKRYEVIAQSGIPEKNPRSRLVLDQMELLEKFNSNDAFSVIDGKEAFPENPVFANSVYCIVNLPVPEVCADSGRTFVWLLEFKNNVPAHLENTAKIVGNSVSEALYFHRSASGRKHFGSAKKAKCIFYIILLAAIAAAMFIRVPESASAEFTLRPQMVSAVYAPFDGLVIRCFRQDGDKVSKGDIIARYDTATLQYRMEQARHQLAELESEISLEERNAFTDSEKLGKVRLLAARKKVLQVAVSEAKWYLDHADITAPADGVLVLADGRAEKLAGKALRIGDKVADIYGGRGLIAEIPVDEKDSSILQQKFTAELFLHTAPEEAIPVDILDTAVYPELTEQKSYCYTVRAELPENRSGLRYGMRGIAKISGRKVFLGYRLFKSAVLCFRGL